jgi:radical SAM protein with 4Fe4S-binding SPASM domain
MKKLSNRIPAISFLPSTAVLELTYACNHKCIFCSCPWEDAQGDFLRQLEMTTSKWKTIISKLCAMGISNIAFTGGEPLVRNDLSKIVEHAALCTTEHIETIDGELVSHYAQPHLYLLSNGRAISSAVLTMCKKYNVQLSLSLPGLETFERHTGYNNAEMVLKAFSMAKALGLKTIANITVTKLNLYELDRVISAALLAGAEQILLNRFLPGGRGLRFARELSLSTADISRMLDTAENTLKNARRFGSTGAEIPRCIFDITRFKSLQIGTRCSAAIHFFVIGPSGYVRVCNHSPVNLNHIDDINNLKLNDYWIRFVQKMYLPASCDRCHENMNCDGGCREAAHIIEGDPAAPDTLLVSHGNFPPDGKLEILMASR